MIPIMKRHALGDLSLWFKSKDRRPLIIRGARQVGKSTLVKLFVDEEKLELLEINLEKTKLQSVLKDSFEINELLDEIQLKTRTKITDKTLIFFDEIQESPQLLKFLRYFYEERPDIAVVAAGSLLEIALKKEDFSFPVGRVEFYHLGPMSFSEFLMATKNDFLLDKIRSHDTSEIVSAEAKRLLAYYYYIGGMPKAVDTYVKTGSIATVRDIQEQIIQTYIADFPKYNSRINVDRVEKVFYSVATQLGKKTIYQRLDSEAKSRDIRKAVELLIDARVLIQCFHTEGNSSPLKAEKDDSIFKLYFLDIGLLNAIMRLEFSQLDEDMKQQFSTKGFLAEQFVAQHLAYLGNERRGPELFYWLKDKGAQKAEVDFLIQKQNQIVPVEVKSTSVGHLKSLFYFLRDKKLQNAFKVSLDSYKKIHSSHKIQDQNIEVHLTNIPHYFIEEIYKL
jgi:predicted AAA+ superfamily ATPase